MTTTSKRPSVRYAFASMLLALTAYTVIESAVGTPARAEAAVAESTLRCGTQENPCMLETISVQARAVDTQLAKAGCGSEAQPCRLEAITVQARRSDARLASTQAAPRMTLRARS
ncbi:MAG TPA: hypothetical protein VF665_13420 [Longimicrobium sp.]|jgi:hypothetical protein|uniref:hypothetical protein n=1 Tax=Longimicrobium sp. TaxID=2029185 RepID=UPI002ED9E791